LTGETVMIASLVANSENFFVRFEFKGQWYLCQRADISGTPHFNYLNLTQSGASLPAPPSASPYGYSYQIIRLPKRIGNALELPTGTCIDVQYSGIGPTDLPTGDILAGMYAPAIPAGSFASVSPLRRITLMFIPGGGIESIYLNDFPLQPTTSVHFLIGRMDKITPTPTKPASSTAHPTTIAMYDPAFSNLADFQSLWVSVSRTTGNVVTSDNQPPNIDLKTANSTQMTILSGTNQQQVLNPQTAAARATYLSYCRLQATNRQQSVAQ
jgi:hypothetical protein